MIKIIVNNEENYTYFQAITKIAYKRYQLKTYNVELEDFRQDCIIELIERLKKYDPNLCNIQTYTYNSIMFTAINTVKYYVTPMRKNSQYNLSFNYDYENTNRSSNDKKLTLEDYVSNNTNIYDNIIVKNIIEYVLSKHNNYYDLYKNVIILLLEKHSKLEIARKLNINRGSVNNIVKNIKKDIIEYYEGGV